MLLALLLASCGGGGGGGDAGGSSTNGDGDPVAKDTIELAVTVLDQVTRAAVADANFTYQAGSTKFAATTDTEGKAALTLPAAEVAGVPYPAASVDKLGYEPQTVLYSILAGGKYYHQEVLLVPLATNVSVPVGGEVVMHLGDDVFQGAANSQFQKATDGAELVYLDAKGWETRICKNLISLSGEVGTVSQSGGNSPSEGYWGGGKQVPFEFPIAEVGVQRAELRVSSGACGGTADIDDFEINRLRVYFCTGTDSCK
jgi:hypothetical protein